MAGSMKEEKKKKTDEEIFGIFYSPKKILSYHRPYMFSVGARSIGKSTGWAIWLILEYLRHKKQFVYVRRTKDELELTCGHWFDNAVNILREAGYDFTFSYKGKKYIINDETAGYAIPLSMEEKEKSANMGGVYYIVYDEFLPKNGRYLGGKGSMAEVDAMSSLFQTIDRDIGKAARNEAKVIFLGNLYTYYNPFFIAYGIDRLLRVDTKYLAPKGELYVVEQTAETEATKLIKESNAYKLSRKSMQDYAYSNKTAESDAGLFLQKIKYPMTPCFTLEMDGQAYGVYFVKKMGVVYVCHRECEGGVHIAATTEDHKPNYLLITSYNKSGYTQILNEAYTQGLIRYQDAKCKNAVDNYFMYNTAK